MFHIYLNRHVFVMMIYHKDPCHTCEGFLQVCKDFINFADIESISRTDMSETEYLFRSTSFWPEPACTFCLK